MTMIWRSIRGEPAARRARTKPTLVRVHFAESAGTVETLEGPVRHEPGDAILYGSKGECWPVPKQTFLANYVRSPSSGDGDLYRKASAEVLALQLDDGGAIELSGGRGLLTGQQGDWIVDYGDNDLAIVRGDIFGDTYELVG